MKLSLKGLFAALLFSIGIGVASNGVAQDIAPINVNSADPELLDELPGVGPSRAEAIIEEREANGDFESADDLTRVSGIGPATVDRMRDQVSVED